MIRRLLTTLVPIIALSACGMPEEGDWPVDETTELGAVEATASFAVSPSPTDGVAPVDGADKVIILNGPTGAPNIVLVSAGGGGNPGGTVSSTQDPIPAKNRHDALDPIVLPK